ncbi:GNAT family N-acetyltransferase [Aeoliella sp. SH292]|uniref:GNAT family N-acetyltransferase n=1 Tax=Aeoliella sp. SH292 TaxID=3454464 RepID=UPI003F9689FE
MDASQGFDTPLIDTARFALRKLRREDAGALFPTFSNEGQCRYLSRPAFQTVDELTDWLLDSSWPGRSWVALDKSDGTIVGRYVAAPATDKGVQEIGYTTVVGRQGQGVAVECMAALVRHLFLNEGCRRLHAKIDAENVASIALIERLGFTREGLLREHETTHKGLCDMAMYGLLRREWRAG